MEKEEEWRVLSPLTIGSSCRWWQRAGVGGKVDYPCLHYAVCGLGE
jgi:hypothetical protein